MKTRLEQLYELRVRLDREISELERAEAGRPPAQRRSRYERPPCGTEQGYQWHRYRKHDLTDDPCGCKRAHIQHNLEQDARRRAAARAAARNATASRMRLVAS